MVLGEIRGTHAMEALLEFLDDEDPAILEAVREASEALVANLRVDTS